MYTIYIEGLIGLQSAKTNAQKGYENSKYSGLLHFMDSILNQTVNDPYLYFLVLFYYEPLDMFVVPLKAYGQQDRRSKPSMITLALVGRLNCNVRVVIASDNEIVLSGLKQKDVSEICKETKQTERFTESVRFLCESQSSNYFEEKKEEMESYLKKMDIFSVWKHTQDDDYFASLGMEGVSLSRLFNLYRQESPKQFQENYNSLKHQLEAIDIALLSNQFKVEPSYGHCDFEDEPISVEEALRQFKMYKK